MSFKSEKKSNKKIVATVIAASLSIGNCTFSTNKPMVSAAYDVRIPQEFMEHGNDYSLDNYYIPEDIATTSTTSAITGTTTITTTTTTSTSTSTDVVTTTTYSEMTSTTEETTVITEAPTEEVIGTPVEVEATEAPREYVVFKPSTHYIHRNSCRWCNSECYEIDSTEGLEARACSECNPDMDIITPYAPPQPTTPTQPTPPTTLTPNTTTTTDTAIAVTDYEYTILCNLVAGEYGSDWVSTYDKGAVVATVIHRVWEGTRWTGGLDGTIYNVIAAPYQYDGKYLSSSYSSKVTESCKEAVTYALNNMSAYDYYTNPDGTSVYMINSFCGDGKYNWFRHS